MQSFFIYLTFHLLLNLNILQINNANQQKLNPKMLHYMELI